MQIYDSSNIIGRAESELYNQNSTTGSSELSKFDFLTLLVAQLQNQDPLNPTDDKEFTAELAQFSQLEELQDINSGVATLGESTVQQQMVSASSYIGKSVRAVGDNLSIHEDGSVSKLYYKLAESASSVFMNIFDSNGEIVRTVQLGAQAAGEHEYDWDGLDWQGKELSEGLYYVALAAESEEGGAILTQTEVSGLVEGAMYSGGQNYLRLSDGRVVAFNYVTEVVSNSSTASTDETTDESTDESSSE